MKNARSELIFNPVCIKKELVTTINGALQIQCLYYTDGHVRK